MIGRRTFLGVALAISLFAVEQARTAAASSPNTPPGLLATAQEKLDLENTLYLDLKDGRVVIKMHPEFAPKHCARIKELVRKGFYDGLIWHRVRDDLVQTGDPKGDGTGGSGQTIPAEFTTGHPHERGMIVMARSTDIDSADSQFVIFRADAPNREGHYSFWGEVVFGMELVDRIHKDDRVIRIQVAADAEKTPR